MYKDILTQINLSPNEAVVYEYLLKNGQSAAGQVIKKTPLKRGVVYNTLAELIDKGLVAKKTKNKIAWFSPEHPDKLRKYIEDKEREIIKAKNSLEANLPTLVSDFNLVSGQPGVRYFEGYAGIKKVSEDSLTAKTEIYTYSDHKNVMKYISKLNQEYIRKRLKLGIRKKILSPDSPETRKFLAEYKLDEIKGLELTQYKLLDSLPISFNTVLQIYDNKISYITLLAERKIGIIIEDENIAKMHRDIFEYNWSKAKSLKETLEKD